MASREGAEGALLLERMQMLLEDQRGEEMRRREIEDRETEDARWGLAESVRLAGLGGAAEARAMAMLARAEGWR